MTSLHRVEAPRQGSIGCNGHPRQLEAARPPEELRSLGGNHREKEQKKLGRLGSNRTSTRLCLSRVTRSHTTAATSTSGAISPSSTPGLPSFMHQRSSSCRQLTAQLVQDIGIRMYTSDAPSWSLTQRQHCRALGSLGCRIHPAATGRDSAGGEVLQPSLGAWTSWSQSSSSQVLVA